MDSQIKPKSTQYEADPGSVIEDVDGDSVEPDYWNLMALEGGSSARLAMFTPAVTRLLREWICRNLKYPFATRQQKNALARSTGLSPLQVTYWLTNARRRLVPRLLRHENRRREHLNLPLMKKPQRGRKSRTFKPLRADSSPLSRAGQLFGGTLASGGSCHDCGSENHFRATELDTDMATIQPTLQSPLEAGRNQADIQASHIVHVIRQPVTMVNVTNQLQRSSPAPAPMGACPPGYSACLHPCGLVPATSPPAFASPLINAVALRSVIRPDVYSDASRTCFNCEPQVYPISRAHSVIHYGVQ